MAASHAATAEDYLAELEPERRREISRVRDAVNAALPPGYVERMSWGMICWEVPLEVSGPTYNKHPLVYAALGAQKNYNSLYLNCVYGSAERTGRLQQAFAAAGRKLDMGKSCIRFNRAEDLLFDAISAELAARTPEEFVRESSLARSR